MTSKKLQASISEGEVLLLQQIYEDGEDDINDLVKQSGMSIGRVVSLVDSLRRKGLLIIHHNYVDTWVKLSSNGKRLISTTWPESMPSAV
ncbi:hypothetical protein KC867_03215 [Candidatus Saccharibacteria bacterium]|nr:hypothetical protein [Candidatus Saccharibacteria bacterium]